MNGKICPHIVSPPNTTWFRWSCRVCDQQGVRMRALSLLNPYPYMILDLPEEHWKNIENRQRSVTSTLGPLLIHAAQRSLASYHDSALKVAERAGVPAELLPKHGTLPGMGILGCVMVSDIMPKNSLMDLTQRWKFPGHVGYVLSKRLKLTFREVSGTQSLFHVDLTHEEQIALTAAGFIDP